MTLSPNEAIVLAGGEGTRLRSVLPDTPKVLAPIGGRPFLHLLFDRLAAQGITSIVLATGYAAELVESIAGDWRGPMTIAFSRELEPLGTGGAISQAFGRIAGERAWIFNGDSFCDVDLPAIADAASAAPKDAWLTAIHVDDASRYGTLQLNGDRIEAYLEKTGRSEPNWISAGIYILPRAVLPASGSYSIERELFPQLAAGGRMRAARAAGRFIDIGTPESFASAEAFFR
ncbi:MAG TPA: sugar phosphate nucleotidyltransferase [Thermoanaerobaculia bacterium]|nr:sugar phosphate nucleotidyltransferase [Thermoanaerobaculia bacterium]